MILRVEHTTEFGYDGPIAEAYTELRLRPLEAVNRNPRGNQGIQTSRSQVVDRRNAVPPQHAMPRARQTENERHVPLGLEAREAGSTPPAM